jgi:cytochrome c556
MRETLRCLMVGAAAATGLAAPASADEAMIKYRQAVMQAIGGHTSGLAAVVKGEVPFADNLAIHTKGIGDLAPIAAKVFPKDSASGRTEALPAIWDKPEQFAKSMAAFQTAAAAVASATDARAAAGALGDLAKACDGCHDTFKKK